MTLIQYTLSDIEDIISKGINYTLDESILKIIQNISDQVGCPEYVKTPKFLTKCKEFSHHTHVRRDKTVRQKSIDENWDSIRHFETYCRTTHEGIDGSIDEIRKTLNKITLNTYETLYPVLIQELDKVILSQHSELDKLGTIIFSIVSETVFFSEMYAELYSTLHIKYDFSRKALVDTLTTFNENTAHIQYCNPDVDYNAFCKNNKENSRRKSIAIFLVNLTKHSIVDVLEICTMIQNIQHRILSLIDLCNNNEIVDELSEISGDMITTGKDKLYNCSLWNNIVMNVDIISKMKPKEHVSLTTKTMFKHMDILDHLTTKDI